MLGCAVSQASALVECREAVTLNPRHASTWSNLGFAFF